tara:strand:- start:2666 stop:2839 length:174 start_codon:yes stop_codon:yes gene_type:complete
MEFHIEYWEQSSRFNSSWRLDSTFLDLGEAQKMFEKNVAEFDNFTWRMIVVLNAHGL